MDFDIRFWKQCCSVKHDRMNFNYVSFESILIIIHEIYMIRVIHPTTCSQHSIVSGFCFFWDALYKVSNQFLIWSQTCLKIWDNFETWKGLSYNLVSIADYASRRPGGLVPPSRRTSQVAIVLDPAVVIELQKCCLERDFPHKMKAFKACEFIHSSFLFRLKLIIIPQFSFV